MYGFCMSHCTAKALHLVQHSCCNDTTGFEPVRPAAALVRAAARPCRQYMGGSLMRTRIALIAAVMLLTLGLSTSLAFAQTPPGPTKVYESKIAVANPPAQADLIQDVLDFAPGAWTPFHRHGGQA